VGLVADALGGDAPTFSTPAPTPASSLRDVLAAERRDVVLGDDDLLESDVELLVVGQRLLDQARRSGSAKN
jgi:hypothetical protein